MPKIVNSPDFAGKIEKIIFDKTNLKTQIKNLDISFSKNLTAELKADLIQIETVLKAENVKIKSDFKTLKIESAEINYLFLDSQKFKNALEKQKTRLENKNKNKKKNNFLLSKIFNVQISKADIVFQNVNIKFENIIFNSASGARYNLKAQKIPVDAVMKALLRFQKSKDPQKKFIENFKNYQGLMEFDLSYENKKLSGFIKAHKLRASSVLFRVPFYFEEPVFVIKDNILSSNAKGTIGGNAAFHNLKITNILSKERETFGEVGAVLDEKLSKKYFPHDIKIVKSADAVVKYHIKNKIPVVEYFLNLDKGSDVFYKTISLGLKDKNRKFYAKTQKRDDELFLEKYFYLYSNFSKIIFGEGLFKRENKKFKPKYITAKTNGFVPLALVGNFGEFVSGGEFSGDLRYDFEKKNLIGNFELKKTFFKDFYIENAKILSDEKTGFIKSNGKYKEEKFLAFVKFQNNFEKKIIVDDMNLFLEKFDVVQNRKENHRDFDCAKGKNKKTANAGNKINKTKKFEEFSDKIDDNNILIKNWQVNINLLKYNKIELEKIKLLGKLEDSVFEFLMPAINYAKGELEASGKYDFSRGESDIFFYSQNIDSDFIAETFFDLENQIKGIAKADLRLKTFDNLKKIKADADFELKNGELTIINSKISKSLSKTSIERDMDLSGADIKGKFEFDNFSKVSNGYILKDINLTSKQESLSMFLSGDYDITSEEADFDIFGKYNVKAPAGIKVFFVPLNWVLNFVFLKKENKNDYLAQINKIPEFKAKNQNKIKQKLFKINIKGNLNKDKIKLDFRGLK